MNNKKDNFFFLKRGYAPTEHYETKTSKTPLRLFPVGCLSMAGHAANPKSSLFPSETLLEGAKFSFAGKAMSSER